MNPLYVRLEATARRMIGSYGKLALLKRSITTGPDYNPEVVIETHSVQMVETGYSMTNRDSTVVQQGDKLGLISTAGTEPLFSDRIEIDGIEYSFLDVKPLNPGGLNLLFEFHARR